MLKIFIGYDPRQPVAVQVLAHSIYSRASKPVSITPLVLSQLPIKRRGLTEFTFTRYLVPHLCDYEGWGIFFDADMLVLGDVYELLSLADPEAAVSVVKNKQTFEWPSMMVFNSPLCKILTPEYIEKANPQSFEWAGRVGELPEDWNRLIGYDEPKPAKLLHYTMGLPCWPETMDIDGFGEEWREEAKKSVSTVAWFELMGNSVHAERVIERLRTKGV